MYFHNKHDESHRKAFKYYMKAAQLGYVPAYTRVGMCYQYAIGVSYDIDEAISYYKRGMELGDKAAYTMMAYLFQIGEGFNQSNYIAYQLHKHANTVHSLWNLELLASYFPDVVVEPNLDLEALKRIIDESCCLL